MPDQLQPQPQRPSMASQEFKEDGTTRMRELYEMEQKRVPDVRPDQVQHPAAIRSDRYVGKFLAKNPGISDMVREHYVPDMVSPNTAPVAPSPLPQPKQDQYSDLGANDALEIARTAMGSPQFSGLAPEHVARFHELVQILNQPDDPADTE